MTSAALSENFAGFHRVLVENRPRRGHPPSMDTPSLDQGIALTLTWGSPGSRRSRTFPVGALVRVGLGLALCALCYEAGRWHGGLEAQVERAPARAAQAARAQKAAPAAEPLTGATGLAPGQAVGEAPDVITPLNARDPSSLVMGPHVAEPQAAQPQSDEPPTPPARIFPRPSSKVKPDSRF
jgi:hypothetical protein